MTPTNPRQRVAKAGGGVAGGRAGANGGSDRRGQLLAIAAQLFATKGYAETTVRDIADEAGILSGSLYHHFSSKEAMLDEILREFLGSLAERFKEIERQGENPREILDELIAVSFATIDANPHAVALYQNESSTLGAHPGFEFVGEVSTKVEKIWIRVLRSGQRDGTFRADIDVNLAYRFIRDAVWSAVRWYRPGGKRNHAGVTQQFRTILHGGLLQD